MEHLTLFEPSFQGQRFEDHSLPFELLGDLATYQSLLIQVAKDLFYEQNPKRKRVPNGFEDSVSLKLSEIEEGSTTLTILLTAISFFKGDFDTKPLFQEAQVRIEQSIAAAAAGKEADIRLSPEALDYFNKIGKNLRADESLVFNPKVEGSPKLQQETRRTLVLASPNANKFEDRFVIRGTVSAFSKKPLSFTLTTTNDVRYEIQLNGKEHKTAKEAFDGFENDLRVKIEGTAEFDRKRNLTKITEVGSVVFLSDLDVPTRIESFYDFENGWYDGEGTAFSRQNLKRISDEFDYYFQTDLMLPYLFPTPDGTLQFEWNKNEHDATFEIDPNTRNAYYHYLDKINDVEDEKSWTPFASNSWPELIFELNKHFKAPASQNT